MTRFWMLALLAMVAGVCIPTQAGINSQLSAWTRSPILAATISFAVGTVVLVAYSLTARLPLPPLGTAASQPWWIWVGGTLGAFFVAVTIYLAPRLGATSLLACLLAGQMIASLVLDHYGLLGFRVHPVTGIRICGVIMLAAGVVLIRYS